MRSLFVMLLCGAIGLGFLASGGAEAQPTKKLDDPEKTLADLLAKVKDKDKEKINVRIDAIMALAEFGPKAAPALPDLLDALQDKNEDLRLNAAIALGKIGKPAVPDVAALLKSPDANTKFYAVWTLGWIGPDAKAVVPAMIDLLGDKDAGVRRKAAFALGRLAGDPEKTIAGLVGAFKDENDEVRQEAGAALSKFGKAAVPSLIELLLLGNPKARQQASISLGDIGAEAREAVPALKELLLEKVPAKANPHHYANMLAKIGGKESVAALEAGFKDSGPEVRQAAAQALQQVGADAVPILIDGLGSKNVEVRRLAAQALGAMRIGDKSVVVALAFALADEDDQVRQSSIGGLAQLGVPAKLASAKIKDALIDLNPNVRQQAYFLLQSLGESPQEALKKGLDSKNDKVRINTASLMVSVGFEVNAATPILVEALKHDDLGLRMQAAFTLTQSRRELDKVVPIFIEGLTHKAVGVRIQAAQGLQQINSADEKAHKALIVALADPEAQVRQHVLYALQNQVNLQAILPELIKLSKDKDLGIRGGIVWMLARAGDDGVPPLADMLKDADVNIRMNASNALRNLGAKAAKVMPAIKEAAIKDENATVRLHCMTAVAFAGGEGPKFLVERFHAEKDSNVRTNLYNTLIYSNNKQHAVPLIKPGMKDASPQVRQAIANSLYSLGRDSKEGFEAFSIGIQDADANVRNQSAYTANLYGNKAWEPLEGALKGTKDSGFRQAILQGMINTQYRSKTSVGPLTDCLKDTNLNVRFNACQLLGSIGPDAADALPQLRELTKDQQPFIQNAARTAITQIEKKK